MKNLHEQFSSIDLLNYLYTKIGHLFKAQHFVQNVLNDALKHSRMVCILGREGMGKSSAIANFIQGTSNVYYVRIGTTYTLTNFFNEMLYQVSGVYPSVSDTLFLKMKSLSYLLTKENTKKLIIIDDAGRLSPRALSVWFELRDNTIQTTAFVFVGLDYFQSKLLKAKKMGVPGIAEFYRRVENFYSVPGLHQSEIGAYGIANNLSEDEVLLLNEMGIETIAELENETKAIKEISSGLDQEEMAAIKIQLNQKQLTNKAQPTVAPKGKTAEEEEDELEEGIATKKKEAAARARAAKKVSRKVKKVVAVDPHQ